MAVILVMGPSLLLNPMAVILVTGPGLLLNPMVVILVSGPGLLPNPIRVHPSNRLRNQPGKTGLRRSLFPPNVALAGRRSGGGRDNKFQFVENTRSFSFLFYKRWKTRVCHVFA
jgi:hypothetical protein